jgi:hypothetical protein
MTINKKELPVFAAVSSLMVVPRVIIVCVLALTVNCAISTAQDEPAVPPATATAAEKATEPAPNAVSDSRPIKKYGPSDVKVAQLIQGDQRLRRSYPYAVSTLLRTVYERTTVKVDPQPEILNTLADPVIFNYPFIYINFADRMDWTFTPEETDNLRKYLDRGGFIFIDAGINAEFLRGSANAGQHHSFGDWDAVPELKDAFKAIYPDKDFKPLKRDHPIYRSFYQGLPDPSILPETVRDFVVEEKWPEGTYSAVALTVKGRIAVLATPIIAMGWGKDSVGNWATTIRFRIREAPPGLRERLETAAVTGESYVVTREDGEKDSIYCQRQSLPAWVNEAEGNWRVFRYYHSREISEYAHLYYTQLAINFITYALTH